MTGLPRVGQLVYSRAGRDSGRPLVVVAIEGDRYAVCSDGAVRPGSRPKRKNVRHLEAAQAVHPGIAAGTVPADPELRVWIAAVTGAGEAREGEA